MDYQWTEKLGKARQESEKRRKGEKKDLGKEKKEWFKYDCKPRSDCFT